MPYIDFDSGASLTSLGFDGIVGALNKAGVGRNSTQALSWDGANDLAEARTAVTMNGARDVCLGFWWKPEVETLWQLVSLDLPTGVSANCVQLYTWDTGGARTLQIQAGNALTVLWESPPSFYTIGTWMYIRLFVRASTVTATGFNANGQIKLWTGASPGALTEQANLTGIIARGSHPTDSGGNTGVYPSAWAYVDFGPQGVIDEISLNYASCDAPNADQPGGTCCGSSGPGGAPPDLEPGETVTSPREIAPGGYPPSYVACTAGGAPATASDPTDAQSPPLGTDTGTDGIPLVHMEWTLADGTKRRYGTRAYTSGNGQSVTARVLRWGEITHALADREGSIESSSHTVLLSDADYAIRTILNTLTTKYVDGREVTFWIESEAKRALATTPRSLGRGVIRNWKTGSDKLTVQLEIGDALGYRYSAFSLDQPFPHHLITTAWAPQCPEHTLNKPIPVIYGEQSDDYVWSRNPARIPAGVVPCIYVGPAHTIPGLKDHYPETDIQAFAVSLGALKAFKSWFGSNLHPNGPGSVRMDPTTAGVDFFIPGQTGWRPSTTYIDVTGTDGITLRLTFICARGPRADDAVSGSVPITVNVCGIEATGNGSGTLITDLAYIKQHFWCYFVLQKYTSGNWGSVPAFADGTAKVRTSSFSTVRTIHNARVFSGADQPSNGYWGGIYMGDRRTKRDWLRELQVKSDTRDGINHHGQVITSAVNDVEDTSGLTTYTASTHVVDAGPLEVDPALDELYNVMEYRWGVEPATGRIAGGPGVFRHAQSITNHAERIGEPFIVSTSFSYQTIIDISGRRLARAQEPTPYVRFKMDMRALSITLGSLFKLTHYEGIDGSGWTGRVLRLIKVVTDPNTFVCTLHCEDMHGYLVLDGFNPFILDTGALDSMVVR